MKRLCISIPKELECYQIKNEQTTNRPEKTFKSGVSVIKDSCGKIEQIEYYTPCGDLLKRVIYKGSSLICAQHYRNNTLYATEDFKDNLVVAKKIFDKSEKVITQIYYEYNRDNQLTGIRKMQDYSHYRIQYGYDELGRVNSRKIWVNTEVVEEQKYRYDIFDRIIEFHDNNQSIIVNKISETNELLSYTITDKIGNEISINNQILAGEYIKTEILLNKHSMNIKDKSYLDNIMLKKPYISEDDFDLAISSILRTETETQTKRSHEASNTNSIIQNKINNATQPLSLRNTNKLNTGLTKMHFTNA